MSTQNYGMNLTGFSRLSWFAVVLGCLALALSAMPVDSEAKSFSNQYRGSDRDKTTLLWFGTHKPFKLRVNASKYDIKMYRTAGGKPAWQAFGKGVATYNIGSDIHYIGIRRTSGSITSW